MQGPSELAPLLPILDRLFEGVLATDDDFRITYMNRAAQQTFAVRASRGVGRTLDEVFIIENFQMIFDEILREVHARGLWQGEVICAAGDGRKTRLECTVAGLSPAGEAAPGLVLFTREAPVRPTAERESAGAETLYRDIVELAQDGICILQEGRIRYANLQLTAILGWPIKDLLETPIERLVAPEELSRMAGLYRDHLAGVRDLGAVETTLVARSGVQIPVEITGSVIRFEGERANLLLIRDVSQRRRAEAALKKSEEELRAALRQAREADLLKSRFLANMSHEIRTPLNAVIGLATILLLQPDLSAPEREGYYRNIKHSGESLLAMINAVLGLAKIESGTIRSSPVPLRLHDFVRRLHARFKPQMDAKLLDFPLHLDPAVPETVVADPILLEQVLNNLLGNAFKFTERGRVALSVSVDPGRDGQPVLHFAVQDTGVGIPADLHEAIFRAFFQVDGRTTREHKGTGLGLAIARESVRLMGGEIRVESEVGVGSTFHVTCPLVPVAAATEARV